MLTMFLFKFGRQLQLQELYIRQPFIWLNSVLQLWREDKEEISVLDVGGEPQRYILGKTQAIR